MKKKFTTIKFIIICWLMPMMYKGDHLSAKCVNGTTCFRSPKDCMSSKTCDFLLLFKYDEYNKEVTFSIGSKHEWVAFGLRKHARFLMHKLRGKICMKTSSHASLQSFENNGYSPSFSPVVGVRNVVTESINGSIICSYSRSVLPAQGKKLVDLTKNLYILASYGSMRGATPSKHMKNAYAISASSVNFRSTKSFPIDLGQKYNSLVTVHGSCMSLSWLVFITIGIFTLRYNEFIHFLMPNWCQLELFTIMIALLLMCAGMVMIFGFKRGWKPEGSDGHAYVGMTAIGFLVLHVCLNFIITKSITARCCFYTIIQVVVGACVLGSGAAAVLTGYNLLNVNEIIVHIWICTVLLSFCASELYLHAKKNANATVPADSQNADNAEQIEEATAHRKMQMTKVITLITVAFATVIVTLATISIGFKIKEGITRH